MAKPFKFALVLWEDGKTRSVVPTDDVLGPLKEVVDGDVSWQGKPYKAKIIKLGNNKNALDKLPVQKDGSILNRKKVLMASASDRNKELLAENRQVKAHKVNNALQDEEDILNMDSVFSTTALPMSGSMVDHIPGSPMNILQSPTSSPVSSVPKPLPHVTPVAGATPSTSYSEAQENHNSGALQTTSSPVSAPVEALRSINLNSSHSTACCVFSRDLAPHITPEGLALFERMLSCMRDCVSEKNSEAITRTPINPNFACDMPGKGKVEMVSGCGVWVSKSMRDLYAARFANDAREMMRQIVKLIFCDKPDYLRTATAKTIPAHIMTAAKAFVVSHYNGGKDKFPSSFTKIINNMCGAIRRGKDDVDIASSQLKRPHSAAASKSPTKGTIAEHITPKTTPGNPVSTDRVLRSATPKKSPLKNQESGNPDVMRNMSNDKPLPHADHILEQQQMPGQEPFHQPSSSHQQQHPYQYQPPFHYQSHFEPHYQYQPPFIYQQSLQHQHCLPTQQQQKADMHWTAL